MASPPKDNVIARLRHPFRPVNGPTFLGSEMLFLDKFGEWMLSQAEVVGRGANREKPFVLEFGGSSGYFAMNLARKGANITIIDRVNEGKAVEAKNDLLKTEDSENGRIDYHVADVTKLTSRDLQSICKGRRPTFVVAQRFIHFLNPSELGHFFNLVATCMVEEATKLAISYTRSPGPTNFYNGIMHYSPEDVARLAARQRLFPEPLPPIDFERGTQVFRKSRRGHAVPV